jgi:hypothetical protein
MLRRLTPKTLRNRAAETLRDALRAYGVTNADDALDDLAEIIRRRDQLADGYGGVAGDTVDFMALARPLRNRLDGLAESDEISDGRIRGQRKAREAGRCGVRPARPRPGRLRRLAPGRQPPSRGADQPLAMAHDSVLAAIVQRPDDDLSRSRQRRLTRGYPVEQEEASRAAISNALTQGGPP